MPGTNVQSALVRLDRVCVDRGPVSLLRDVSVEVHTRDVVVCSGDNGAGKTTLLRVLGGLVGPSRGSVERRDDRGRADLVGHASVLHPDLTLAENLDLVARLVGRDETSVHSALAHVGLAAAADRRAGRCSEGMRRRTDLARLLLTRPSLLLLDEPDVALDHRSRPLVREAVERTVAAGGAVVVVTHVPDRLEDLATTSWSVRDGAVVV